MSELILETRNLTKHFEDARGLIKQRKTTVKAVDSVNIKVVKGETVGLVGESGCGKTTAGRTVLKLLEPTSGEIFFDGVDISRFNQSQMKPFR